MSWAPLDQNLKSFCARSIAASMKSCDWDYRALKAMQQLCDNYFPQSPRDSRCRLILSVLTPGLSKTPAAFSLRGGGGGVSTQPLRIRCFYKRREHGFKHLRKHLKWYKGCSKANSEVWQHSQRGLSGSFSLIYPKIWSFNCPYPSIKLPQKAVNTTLTHHLMKKMLDISMWSNAGREHITWQAGEAGRGCRCWLLNYKSAHLYNTSYHCSYTSSNPVRLWS